MLKRWMDQPHWQEWWGEPDAELADIANMIDGNDTTEPYVFEIAGEPLGFIQVWHIADQLKDPLTIQAHPWILDVPGEAVGVDLAMGSALNLSKGIGTVVLRCFAERLHGRGHRTIITDPDPENTRAVRAYGKAGFTPIAKLEGRYPGVLLMQHQE